MKLILEKETGQGEDRKIIIVKEVIDMAQAMKDKGSGKHFLHYCFHGDLLADGKSVKPCKRRVL